MMHLVVKQYMKTMSFSIQIFETKESESPLSESLDLTLVDVFLKVNELARQRTAFSITAKIYDDSGNIRSVSSFSNKYLLLSDDERGIE